MTHDQFALNDRTVRSALLCSALVILKQPSVCTMKIGKCATIIVAIILALIKPEYVQTASFDIRQRYERGVRCGLDKFDCHNGECIASEKLCDGRPDCTDQSDETREECSKPELTCPDYAFRCDYGACVDGDAACNGVKDCIDNSDELLPRCSGVTTSNVSTSSRCSENQFRCNDGSSCIDDTSVCDGNVDCADKSDETYTKCASFNCPQVVFRCDYGACIDGDLTCNGVNNCADGSDENPFLCNTRTTTTVSNPRTSTPTPTPTPTQTPSWTPGLRSPCRAPPQPPNGHWKLHASQCPNKKNCDVPQGIDLEPGAYLVYSCNPGYRVRGSVDVLCGPQGKWLNIPICIEIRCNALNSASTEAVCTYNNEWTSCDTPVLPQTTAKVSCRNSYRQDVTFLTAQRDHVKCNDRGRWEPEPIRCIPVCGVVAAKTTPLIIHGTRPNVTDFPWHATLYKAEKPNEEKTFICGATIIQDNLLITAAHCVYDDSNKRIENPSKFYVATGNIFREYDSPYHDLRLVKKAQVKNIYITCSYLGLEGNYAWDIAILQITKPFVLSSILIPICLDINEFNDQTVLQVGNFGKVAGFGRTESGPSSYILQSITVPYVPPAQCKSQSSVSENERYITMDKFCAGYTNGSSVCDGDSGGGLVFKTGGLWYLRGIVSVGIGTILVGGSRVCDSHSYSLYTKVSSHIGWIQDVILKLETFKSSSLCSTNNK